MGIESVRECERKRSTTQQGPFAKQLGHFKRRRRGSFETSKQLSDTIQNRLDPCWKMYPSLDLANNVCFIYYRRKGAGMNIGFNGRIKAFQRVWRKSVRINIIFLACCLLRAA